MEGIRRSVVEAGSPHSTPWWGCRGLRLAVSHPRGFRAVSRVSVCSRRQALLSLSAVSRHPPQRLARGGDSVRIGWKCPWRDGWMNLRSALAGGSGGGRGFGEALAAGGRPSVQSQLGRVNALNCRSKPCGCSNQAPEHSVCYRNNFRSFKWVLPKALKYCSGCHSTHWRTSWHSLRGCAELCTQHSTRQVWAGRRGF